ncbi:Pxmp2 [Symbiodinium pilosum]|uniref:Pxmp2 protein n=1 Tax=Symbiodinium pilosum TaxID=2952 RepID=A0A812NC62_SYMPI|nr:Pxmp2 [Symbiodinium pilosum]
MESLRFSRSGVCTHIHTFLVFAAGKDSELHQWKPLATRGCLHSRCLRGPFQPTCAAADLGTTRSVSLPSAWPCASTSLPNSQETEVLCRERIEAEQTDAGCLSERCKWKYLSQKLQMEGLFGAQVRSVPTKVEAEMGPEADVLHVEIAARHYSACHRLGGQFFGAAFVTRDGDYDLGVCAPVACPVNAVRWWTVEIMSMWHPGFSVPAQNITVTELAHIAEVDLQWVIAGVGRSGTTSLAAWLKQHPQLELLADPADVCLEGGLNYLFRRTYLQHLVPRKLLGPVGAPHLGGQKTLRGTKDWSLLQFQQGRRVLGQLKQVRVLVIVKDWLDWLKSASSPSVDVRSLEELLGNGSDWMPFHHANVASNLRDAEQLGLRLSQVKVFHLRALHESAGLDWLNHLAVWLGAEKLNPDDAAGTFQFPSTNSWHPSTWQAAWYAEVCKLPRSVMQRLEEKRREATKGLPALLRQSQKDIPETLLRPSEQKPAGRELKKKRVMLLSCKRPVTTEAEYDVYLPTPEEHALVAVQEASGCDADFVEAAAAAVEEADEADCRMPDDAQDQPALKRLRGMIEGPSNAAIQSTEGMSKEAGLWFGIGLKKSSDHYTVVHQLNRLGQRKTAFAQEQAAADRLCHGICCDTAQDALDKLFFTVMTSQSVVESVAAWKRVPGDMLEMYGEFAILQPILAKSLTSGVAYVLGDLIAQRVEAHSTINVSRCIHNGITGLILHGPILHFWILFLEGPFSQLFSSGDSLLAIVAKVVMDQTLFSAILNAAYALLLGILAGNTLEASIAHVRKTVPPAMFSSWRFWPFVHLVTYSPLMPIEFKVLWNDVAEVVWVAILSYIANVKTCKASGGQGPSDCADKVSVSA